ncbi:MAG: RNA polymerase sigma factor [Gammaproteobacteria bacterium]
MQPGCVRKLVDIQHDKSDTALIEVIRAQQRGWPRAMSTLLKRYENELLHRCQYRLGNFHDAEDALQATLLRAYRAILMFEGNSSLRTWLYTIADNQCNTMATRRNHHVLSEHLSTLIEIHECSTRRHVEFIDKEQVNLTLNILSEKTKQILKMRYYMELSLEEIAHNLGIGLSAAKMRLYRAQDTFKSHYEASIAASCTHSG